MGTRMRDSSAKYGANRSCLESPVIYSSQPDESTTTGSEPVVAITVNILPLHVWDAVVEVLNRATRMDADGSFEDVHLQLLAGVKFEFFADAFGYDDLILR